MSDPYQKGGGYSRERSRDKRSNNWDRDRRNNDHSRDKKNWKDNRDRSGYSRDKNYYGNSNRYDKTNEKTRKVHQVKVEDPKSFIISDNPSLNQKPFKKFLVKIQTSEQVPEPLPVKKNSRVDELKDKITPVQRIWSSHVKQYLNDSEFVQIYRKGKSLAYGEIEYGKTMIKYDQGDKEMLYENQTAQSKVFSRAYFKIWEILAQGVFKGKQSQALTMASVAEGPGGFIHALVDFRLKNAPEVKDDFYSITLKIDNNTRNAKDWTDNRGKAYFGSMRNLGYKIKLSYGSTGTGDLLKPENIDHFAVQDLKEKKCYLVTGDGGIQCIGDKQFDYQEVFNVKLFLGQIITALKIQQIGGKFILKVYDCCFGLTRQLMTLLAAYYKKVTMIKPVTSRPGNSQKYMLCEDFIGISQQQQKQLKALLLKWVEIEPKISYFENTSYTTKILQFPQLSNTKQIWDNLQESNKYFLEQQAQKLEQGLKIIEDNDGDVRKVQNLLKQKRFEEQMSYAYQWCKRYGLTPIHAQLRTQENNQ